MAKHRNGMLLSQNGARLAYRACVENDNLISALSANPYKTKRYRQRWHSVCVTFWKLLKDQSKIPSNTEV